MALVAVPSTAQTDLFSTTLQAQAAAHALNQQREATFEAQEKNDQRLRDALLAQKAALQANIDKQNDDFTRNEQALAEQETTLALESGSLGELFGVVRQVAKQFKAEQGSRVAMMGDTGHMTHVNAIVDAKTLPSRAQLYGLWQAFTQQLNNSAQLTAMTVPFVDGAGVMQSKPVIRLGAFGLVGEQGYLKWVSGELGARAYAVQPEFAPILDTLKHNQQTPWVALDPSQGQLIDQLALAPTLAQRIAQGGGIGKVILAILGLGLIIGLVQGAFLFSTRLNIQAQLKHKESVGNNALGRILSVYKYDSSRGIEALELRLYETVMDEQQKLERGLSLIKLLAALAPMLGLLGTVTGMIETFQVITALGHADPRMMASGISTALVTTVLGLVAAMPLLFIHNVLNSQAENVRAILEMQGIGLVAQRAEQDMAERSDDRE
jgi:biopolymer transport protein ExbB